MSKLPSDAAIRQFQLLVQNGIVHRSQVVTMQHFLEALREDPEPQEVALMHGSRQVCPECRAVAPVIITCSHANKIWVGPKWRAPKKTNDRAWKRIAEGDVLWDHGAVAAKAKKEAEHRLSAEELLRRKRRKTMDAIKAVKYR